MKSMYTNSTIIGRKCRTCVYYDHHNLHGKGIGWCYWLGKKRFGNQYECEDGYKLKERGGKQ